MFKKLFILIALTVTLAGAAEKFKFPGFGRKEADYAATLSRINAGEITATPAQKILVTLCKEYASGAPDNLTVILARAQELNATMPIPCYDNGAAPVYTFISNTYGKGNVISYALLNQLYEHLKTTGDRYLVSFMRSKNVCNALNITADIRVAVVTERVPLIETPTMAAGVVDVLCDALPKTSKSDAEQLAILKKYNKIYSVHLTDANKDKWEPILTKLRTVILAY